MRSDERDQQAPSRDVPVASPTDLLSLEANDAQFVLLGRFQAQSSVHLSSARKRYPD